MLYNRVLITGANGLLGQTLTARLSRQPEYDVLATARDAEPRLASVTCGYAPLDVTDAAAAERLFQDFAPGVVVNCAAMTQVDRCEAERRTCWAVNAEATEALARLCRTHSARLVQVSTDFVFDGTGGPYREDARPNPVNFYGRSKLAAENAAREAGMNQWAIARTVLVYGTAENMSRSNFVLWVADQLARGEHVHIVTDQFRSPTYVEDLADGIERIIRYEKTGVFHLSGREQLSVYDFAHVVAEVYGLDASLIDPIESAALDQAAQRPPRTGFIILKAETELGYKPRALPAALRHLGVRLGLPVGST